MDVRHFWLHLMGGGVTDVNDGAGESDDGPMQGLLRIEPYHLYCPPHFMGGNVSDVNNGWEDSDDDSVEGSAVQEVSGDSMGLGLSLCPPQYAHLLNARYSQYLAVGSQYAKETFSQHKDFVKAQQYAEEGPPADPHQADMSAPSVPACAACLLAELPSELLLRILGMMRARELCNFAMVSHYSKSLLAEPTLWRELVTWRFAPVRWALPEDALQCTEDMSWRDLYFKINSEWRQLAVATHCTESSCWLLIDQELYDVTHFLNSHPGMASSLLMFAGGDATQAFSEVYHSPTALQMMQQMRVDRLHLDVEGCPACLLPPKQINREGHAYSAQAAADIAQSVASSLGHAYSSQAAADVAQSVASSLQSGHAYSAQAATDVAQSLASSLGHAYSAQAAADVAQSLASSLGHAYSAQAAADVAQSVASSLRSMFEG